MTVINYNSTTVSISMAIDGGDAADYPKSYGAWNIKAWGRDADNNITQLEQVEVRIHAAIQPNGVMGKTNETGLARMEKFVKHAIKLHGPVQFKRTNNFINNTPLPAAIARLGEEIQ